MLPGIDINKYRKSIVAILGAVVTVLQTVWPTSHWSIVATTVATAILVHLIPNSTTESQPPESRK
jgi:hypothetical protein